MVPEAISLVSIGIAAVVFYFVITYAVRNGINKSNLFEEDSSTRRKIYIVEELERIDKTVFGKKANSNKDFQ
ncbi:MAG: hypothetical protein FWD27_05200 [Coriobacteriia bacterium]|nr:hypothetical protein [Coriobacteriia bacterium]